MASLTRAIYHVCMCAHVCVCVYMRVYVSELEQDWWTNTTTWIWNKTLVDEYDDLDLEQDSGGRI